MEVLIHQQIENHALETPLFHPPFHKIPLATIRKMTGQTEGALC